jgi:transcriptional pleiotropic regulator of transition state genes
MEDLYLAFFMELMVKIMDFMIKVDKQGRTVIPKEIRQALGISENTEIICRVFGEKIILERFSPDSIYKAFNELEEIAPDLDLDRVSVEMEDKYFDKKYALRKIGL